MSTTGTATLPDTIKEFWDKRLLLRAVPNLHHNRWGRIGIQPRQMGKTYEWRRFTELSTVLTPLSEGVTPAPVQPAMTKVTMEAEWYGSYIAHTDQLEYEAYDPIIESFSDLLGEQCGRSIDLLTRAVLVAGLTTVVRPGTITTDANITATDVLTYTVLSKAVATLAANNALPAEGQQYIALVHPHVVFDMLNDENIHKVFQAASEAESTNPFRTGYIGRLLNVDFYQSSHGYIDTDAGSGNVDVYTTFLFGKEAYGVGGISGFTPNNVDSSEGALAPFGGLTDQKVKPVEIIFKELGSGGSLDPLNQRATSGWKASHVSKVLNVNFALAIHTASSMGANA